MILPPGAVLPPLEPEVEPPSPATRRRRSPPKRHRGDRFRCINDFVDVHIRSLTRAEALIWLTLWRDTRDGLARTSYSSLSRTCGCRRATVTNALRGLREKGLIEVVQRGGKGFGANIYRVCSAPGAASSSRSG